jgi:hypothetical protein
MKSSDEYQLLLKAKGISLEQLGIRDIALERDEALLAVEILRKASIPIFGGDVYWKRGEAVELAYANWHSDPGLGEKPEHFASRSCLTAEDYIKKFCRPLDATVLFALVIGG